MSLRYKKLDDGGRFMIIPGANIYTACCDCELVHREVYEIGEHEGEPAIFVQVWRDNRRTGQKRRHAGTIIEYGGGNIGTTTESRS